MPPPRFLLVLDPKTGAPVKAFAKLVGFSSPDAASEAQCFAPLPGAAAAAAGGAAAAGSPPAAPPAAPRVEVVHLVTRLPLYIGRGWGAELSGEAFVRALTDERDRERPHLGELAHWLHVEHKNISRLHAVVDWDAKRARYTFECVGKVADVGRERVGKGALVDIGHATPLRVGTAFLYFLEPLPPAERPSVDAADAAVRAGKAGGGGGGAAGGGGGGGAGGGGARRARRVEWRAVIARTYSASLSGVGFVTTAALAALAPKACPDVELPEDEKKVRTGVADFMGSAKNAAALGFVIADASDVPADAKERLATFGKSKVFWQHVGVPAAQREAARAAAAAAATERKESEDVVID